MVSRRSVLKCAALSLGAPLVNRGFFSLFAQDDTEYSARTLDLVRGSTVIDMLGLLTLDYRKVSAWATEPDRFKPADLVRLKESGITVFHPAVGYTSGDIYAASYRDIVGWNAFIASHSEDFQRIDSGDDFKEAKTLGKIGILIGQQNSSHFRTVEDVNRFYNVGQRVSQLTYTGNKIGGGSSDAKDSGLSPYGVQIVERMNEVGMAIDISHCSDRTTMD
ncbi:MAG TPA: membrane dipeptidase, partial [Bryobacteraceae bacterium]|nr:membrane dipeptidase [Bryobacteraceae bacterium]